MIRFFVAGGDFMIPLVIIAMVVVVLAFRSARRLAAGRAGPVVEAGIDAILFWGVFGVIVGALGTLGGIGQAALVIEAAGVRAVRPRLLWGALSVTLYPTILALAILSVALLLWSTLRVRYRRIMEAV